MAQKLAKKDAIAASRTPDLAQASIDQVTINAAPTLGEPSLATAQSAPAPSPSAEVVEAGPAESPAVVEPAVAQPAATNSPDQSTANSDDSPWIGLVIIGLVLLAVIAWIRSRLHRLFKVCPKCKKWGAGALIDWEESSHTGYETRTFTDEHRDRHGQRTGSTVKQRQVSVVVTDTVETLKCRVCNNVWSLSSRSKSG